MMQKQSGYQRLAGRLALSRVELWFHLLALSMSQLLAGSMVIAGVIAMTWAPHWSPWWWFLVPAVLLASYWIYRFQRWVNGERQRLLAHYHYWRGRPDDDAAKSAPGTPRRRRRLNWPGLRLIQGGRR